jgi:hypothetical protein
MEMPIQMIITLFIVIAAGGMVLLFAQTTINRADNALPQLDKDPKGEQVLEVASTTSTQIGFLIEECYKNSFGKIFKDQTCFIVHSASPYTVSEADIKSALSNNSILGTVDNGSGTKTVYIKWNFGKSQIDVKI